MAAEAFANVEGCDIARPDAEEEKEEKGNTVLLIENLRQEHERIGDVDQEEETDGGLPEDALQGRDEGDDGEEY